MKKPFVNLHTWTMVIFLAIVSSCADNPTEEENGDQDDFQPKVEVKNISGRYLLFVDGEKFVVKGAGLDFNVGQNFKALKEAGGNTFRTWITKNADNELDSAAKYDLKVAMGLDIHKELHGFDYNNEQAVSQQLERIKAEIDKYKDHPNLLCWVAGNELNLLFNADGSLNMVNPKTYIALKDIVDYIHEVDPHHPVTTTFAGALPEHVAMARQHCPDLDFLSIQVYGDLEYMDAIISNAKIDMPYMVTEYGPRGHWEMPTTEWGREIEEPSGPKARGMADRIQKGIVQENSGLQIGNFAFLWGQKQERTPTWYGMFNKNGEPNARVDEMTKFWTGAYPTNRAPLTESITINNLKPEENIYLVPGQTYTCTIEVEDPDGDELTTEWIILEEVGTRSQGGAFEQEPARVDFQIINQSIKEIEFVAPTDEGDYRLFAYVRDGKGKVGNVNAPFFVKN